MFEVLFELCHHSNGFTYEELYRMPVRVRDFNYQMLVKTKNEEQKQADAAQKGNTGQTTELKGPMGNRRKLG